MAENARAMPRKAGGARQEKKGPRVTFSGALGAGAQPQRKDGVVMEQTVLLLTRDEELRWKVGGKTWRGWKRREEEKGGDLPGGWCGVPHCPRRYHS